MLVPGAGGKAISPRRARGPNGVHTNPKKSAFVTFTPADKLIVLAES
jgi:hypothetical protein